MREDGKVDYVEMPGGELPATKAFYARAFTEGLDGGFFTGGEGAVAKPLVILYAHDLEAMEAKVRAAGGAIVKPIFSFPGGRRFHFTDPAGNELAVWSEGGA